MLRALVVNASAKCYNLGAEKLHVWLQQQGYEVTRVNGDPGIFSYGYALVAVSVIFSWHAPIARDLVNRVKHESEVWVGGPGLFALQKWFIKETGIAPHVGVDERFDKVRGTFKMAFASRGCPVGCWFCIVPKLEGKDFTLDWDFQPAPILCDNNLSGLPVGFQEHIIASYKGAGVALKDANSGFEPRSFDEDSYQRWRHLLEGPWRFAFDEQREREDVLRMLEVLRAERARRKRVYVLVGNEPYDSCLDRVRTVIDCGGEPYCQFVLPLNWLGDPADLRPRHDWTYQRGRDFCRYINTFGYKQFPIEEYRPRLHEDPPFATTSEPDEAAIAEVAFGT